MAEHRQLCAVILFQTYNIDVFRVVRNSDRVRYNRVFFFMPKNNSIKTFYLKTRGQQDLIPFDAHINARYIIHYIIMRTHIIMLRIYMI